MEQHEDTTPTHYPLGRGYGHDYMRGGEVFGGYGYRDREEYLRTRGGEVDEEALPLATEVHEFPFDGVPHDAPRAEHAAGERPMNGAASDGSAPVPQLEHTYGDTGSSYRHSRSYYVTQAQLQQRIYGVRPRSEGPYRDRLATLPRADDDVKRDVQESLFHDTWVDANRIQVHVEDGRVVLRGDLPNADEIRFARDDAWAVAGVREVVCELRVVGD